LNSRKIKGPGIRAKGLQPAGNLFDKYHTQNPVYRYLVNRFLKALDSALRKTENSKSLLDVGCGEGHLLNRVSAIRRFARLEGVDISGPIIGKAKSAYPAFGFSTGSACALAYKNGEFDIVMACEALEHIKDYKKALSELGRVSAKYLIISVPLEPLWRALNVARGAHIGALGNTPGHVNHWGRKGFIKILSEHFRIEKLYYPMPWQIALCLKKYPR